MHFLNDGSQSLSSVRRGVWDTNVARGILAIGLLLFSASCSAWKATDSDPLQLPSPRVSADSVSLEITFVRVPTGETNFNDELWGQVDEQCLDSEIRQGLNDNGFRVGLVGSQLPEVLRKVLDEQSQQNRLDQLVASEMDVLAQTRRIQNRGGQRNEIVAGPPQDELVVLYRAPGQSKVTGKPLHDAQCILAVRCFPQVSGGAK